MMPLWLGFLMGGFGFAFGGALGFALGDLWNAGKNWLEGWEANDRARKRALDPTPPRAIADYEHTALIAVEGGDLLALTQKGYEKIVSPEGGVITIDGRYDDEHVALNPERNPITRALDAFKDRVARGPGKPPPGRKA